MSPQGADRDVTVRVATDKMSAEMTVPEGFEPSHLTVSYVEQVAIERGVRVDEKVRTLIRDAIESRNGREAMTTIIAHGLPPAHGDPGRIDWLVDRPRTETTGEQAETPPTDENADRVSHYDRSAFIVVDSGQLIGRIIEPTAGEDGYDVAGEAVRAKPGTPAKLDVNDTLQIKPNGEIVALCRGVLERSKTRASVETQLTVDSHVDFSTGNIDFCGDVIIAKGIRDRFRVRAEGNVEVHGLIEAAEIECQGDLIAKGGFAGGEYGRVDVSGNVHARYLNDVRGRVEGSLKVDKELINCELVVEGELDAPSATLIGGTLQLVNAGTVNEVGSQGGIHTEIVLGALPKLEPLAHDLQRIIDTVRQQLDSLRIENENLKYLKKPNAQQKERMTEIMCDFSTAEMTLRKAEGALEHLEARMEAQRVVDVTINTRIHPAVTVIYRGLPMCFKDEVRGPARIRRNEKSDLIVERQGRETPIEHLAGLGTTRTAA